MSETAAISMDNSLFKFYNDIIPIGLLRKSYPSRDKCERNAKHTHTRRLGDNSITIQYQRSGISKVLNASAQAVGHRLCRSCARLVCASRLFRNSLKFSYRGYNDINNKGTDKINKKFTSQKISFLTFIAFSILHSVFMILHIQRNKEHTEYKQEEMQSESERLWVCVSRS